MKLSQFKFRLSDDEVVFNICQYIKRIDDLKVVSIIESIDEVQLELPIEERLGAETLEAMLMNFKSDGIPDYDETVKDLGALSFSRHQVKLELDLKIESCHLLDHQLMIYQC